jgi:hypothetical protein
MTLKASRGILNASAVYLHYVRMQLLTFFCQEEYTFTMSIRTLLSGSLLGFRIAQLIME